MMDRKFGVFITPFNAVGTLEQADRIIDLADQQQDKDRNTLAACAVVTLAGALAQGVSTALAGLAK